MLVLAGVQSVYKLLNHSGINLFFGEFFLNVVAWEFGAGDCEFVAQIAPKRVEDFGVKFVLLVLLDVRVGEFETFARGLAGATVFHSDDVGIVLYLLLTNNQHYAKNHNQERKNHPKLEWIEELAVAVSKLDAALLDEPDVGAEVFDVGLGDYGACNAIGVALAANV